jgi:hypothetical protein
VNDAAHEGRFPTGRRHLRGVREAVDHLDGVHSVQKDKVLQQSVPEKCLEGAPHELQ